VVREDLSVLSVAKGVKILDHSHFNIVHKLALDLTRGSVSGLHDAASHF